MATVTDQMGYPVNIPDSPQRIISLVPSQTELLFDLGLDSRIVGVTKFCIHPAGKVKSKTVIGGTKNFHFAQIDALQPDLIIGNKEENYRTGILQLKEKYPVWMSDISTLPEALDMMQRIGTITNQAEAALALTAKIATSFQHFSSPLNVPTAYFIWRNPCMSVGRDTFIHQMLAACGLQNVFAAHTRYPEISSSLLQVAAPKLILLSSEPYPFRKKHVQEFQHICPGALIRLVDGELFSWYGSRLQYAVPYFQKLLREIDTALNK